MDTFPDEVLEELSDNQIIEFIEFYQKVPNKEDVIFVPLYLICQLNWNKKLCQMSGKISVRCKQKFYKYKKGKTEHATIIGITGENVVNNISIISI